MIFLALALIQQEIKKEITIDFIQKRYEIRNLETVGINIKINKYRHGPFDFFNEMFHYAEILSIIQN